MALAENNYFEIDLTGLDEITNDTFFPLYADDNQYLVLKGGAGSGKSVFAAQKIVYKCLDEPGHHVLVVRKTFTSNRKSTFPLLVKMLKIFGIYDLCKVNKTEMEIVFPACDGKQSVIWFAGCNDEDDLERLKSILDISIVWIEEASELDVTDFRLLVTRMRNEDIGLMQMILTFNPISVTSWLKTEFFDNPKDNATIHESTYHDNRFISPKYVRELEAFKDTDDYYYTVYVLNQWGVVGRTVFNMKNVSQRYTELQRLHKENRGYVKKGYFEYDLTTDIKTGRACIDDATINFIEDDKGYITIYIEPEEGRYYVLGADTAGDQIGADKKDFFASHVMDSTTNAEAAVFHEDRIDEDEFACQQYCLGWYYNKALIGIETNYSLAPTKLLEELQYPNMYMRETEDTVTHRVQKKYGVITNKRTRPLMINGLTILVRDNIDAINDIKTLEEMMTFVRNDKGRPEAQSGKHDDLVISYGIALYIKSQQDTVMLLPDAPKKSEIQTLKEKHMRYRDKNRRRGQLARLN